MQNVKAPSNWLGFFRICRKITIHVLNRNSITLCIFLNFIWKPGQTNYQSNLIQFPFLFMLLFLNFIVLLDPLHELYKFVSQIVLIHIRIFIGFSKSLFTKYKVKLKRFGSFKIVVNEVFDIKLELLKGVGGRFSLNI